MPTSTLLHMAQRACARHVNSITDFGDLPYILLKPILTRIDNPQHLLEIERSSPHIADYDAELWRAFIVRDIPNATSRLLALGAPSNPRSWWKVYRKLIREEEKRKLESEAQLRAAMMGEARKREENQATFVHKVVPGGPKPKPMFVDGQRATRENGWNNGMPARGASLKNARTGAAVLSAIRKQSGAAQRHKAIASGQQTMRALQPGKILNAGRKQIVQAPRSMVMGHAPRPAPQVPSKSLDERSELEKTSTVFSSFRKQPTAQDRALDAAVREERAAREDRLRALTSGGSKPAAPTSPSKVTRPAIVSGGAGRVSSPIPAAPARKRPAANAFLPAKRKKVS